LSNLTDIARLEDSSQKIGVTIGNFDGVHIGHQFLINELKKLTSKKNEKLALITFVPHPRFILDSISSNFLICSYNKRRELLENFDIDYLIEIKFNRDFSSLEPGHFLDQYILAIENVSSFYLGHDFTFGA